MTHLGGVQAPVVVITLVEALVTVDAVVTKTWMLSDSDIVAVAVPDVPVIVITLLVDGAVLETAKESTELALPPGSGVTGLTPKPPLTPNGKVDAARVTGELKLPTDCTVTVAVPVPPGLMVRLLGLTERLNKDVAVTVNVPVADLPALPSAIIM